MFNRTLTTGTVREISIVNPKKIMLSSTFKKDIAAINSKKMKVPISDIALLCWAHPLFHDHLDWIFLLLCSFSFGCRPPSKSNL